MKGSIFERHPQTVLGRVRPDGGVKPFSVDEQWKQVGDWFRFLKEADEDEDYDSMDAHLEAWDALEPIYAYNGKNTVERGEELRRVSGSPLSALFYMIDMGIYPPPELLLTLLDCWNTYSWSSGGMSLEEAFLGKPVQKAGNFAKRSRAKHQKVFIEFQFLKEVRAGRSREDAAATVSEMVGGKPEPESILRMVRGLKPRPRPDTGGQK